jgi:hypothetical protein
MPSSFPQHFSHHSFRITPSMLLLLLFSLLLTVSASPSITDPTQFPGLENSTTCILVNSISYLPGLLNCATDDWPCVCNDDNYATTFITVVEGFCGNAFPSNYSAVAGNATTDLIQFCDQLNLTTRTTGTTNNTSSCTKPSQRALTVSHDLYHDDYSNTIY